MEIKKWLDTTITRRDAIVATAKVGAAATLSQAITLPFCCHCQGAGYHDTEGRQRRNRQAQRLSGQLWQPMPA
ncbi:anaerobic dimethyl sulfoxide reductase subunit A [Salmonella enterica subsp. indica]|uniref:Anaerobic dimethyl sulfoxide reductase subunit A n=1 Tax=Salmonella enterica subsp. indica TaxID=59207 RepID=A0A379XVN3_SALER|nr:anaerobic dimethyl sulfoxide reductase subunit A [Salmonella enterica subsp. indica]